MPPLGSLMTPLAISAMVPAFSDPKVPGWPMATGPSTSMRILAAWAGPAITSPVALDRRKSPETAMVPSAVMALAAPRVALAASRSSRATWVKAPVWVTARLAMTRSTGMPVPSNPATTTLPATATGAAPGTTTPPGISVFAVIPVVLASARPGPGPSIPVPSIPVPSIPVPSIIVAPAVKGAMAMVPPGAARVFTAELALV